MSIMQQFDDATLNSLKIEFNQIEREASLAPREKLDALQSAPMKDGVNKGAMTFTFKKITEVGVAAIVASDAKELPPVSLGITKDTVEIRTVGDSYMYTDEEINAWAFAGQSLDHDEAIAARHKVDEKVDAVIYVGDEKFGFTGLLNNANVTQMFAGSNADESSTAWADKTLDEITKDIQDMVNVVFEATKGPRGGGTIEPDTIKIPRAAYVSLTNRTKGVDSDVTFLKALQDRFAPQGIKNWDCCNSCNGIGVGGTDRALLYKKGKENVFSILPVPFKVLPAQHNGLCTVFNCIARTAGCAWRRPSTGCYMDGI